MNSLENVIQLIRNVQRNPYLDLYHKQTAFEKNLVGRYECNNCVADEPDDSRTDKAIQWLEHIVSLYPDGSQFLVYAKTAPRANQGGILGPYEFVKRGTNALHGTEPQHGLTVNARELAGLGYVHETAVQAKLLEQQLDFNRQMHELRAAELESEYKRNLEDYRTVNNRWTPENVKGLLELAVPALGALFGKGGTALAGTSEAEKPLDPKTVFLESIAQKLATLDGNALVNADKLLDSYVQNVKRLSESKEQNVEHITNEEQ